MELAQWLVEQEQNVCMAFLTMKQPQTIPRWLQDGLVNAKHLAHRSGLDDLWEGGAAVKKHSLYCSKKILIQKSADSYDS